MKKLQEDLHTQAQEYEAKLAKKDEEIQKVKDVAGGAYSPVWLTLTTHLDPTVYKRGLELIDLGKVGTTYPAQSDLRDWRSKPHREIQRRQARDGPRQNHLHTKEKRFEQLEPLHQNGKIGIWKWTEPNQKNQNQWESLKLNPSSKLVIK